MSDALEKAEAAAREAAENTDVARIVAAVLAAQQAVQQQPSQQQVCQHQHKPGRSAGEWLAIGCAVCVGGIGLALGFLAVAIAACCATGCFVILRQIWRDAQKGK
ncbi:hypothetical protein AB0I54_31765 [Streptomyces sp. NPDC050625]|uniref:hypothetical protein n=1 Tax=Streptomyces sp. NPDC050625 TaxID=3154629 RepID=UPI003417395D